MHVKCRVPCTCALSRRYDISNIGIFSCDSSSIGRNVGRSATIEFQKHFVLLVKPVVAIVVLVVVVTVVVATVFVLVVCKF